MPGSSLWLTPPPSHPLYPILSFLISQRLPSDFPSEAGAADARLAPEYFAPHMTLSSGISPGLYGDDPQRWLDSIPWPSADEIKVRFEGINSQDTYYRRCYAKVKLDVGIKKIAGLARARGVNGEEDANGEKTQEWLEWWRKEFGPHVSLMYGDVPISDDRLKEITKVVEEGGVKLTEPEGNVEGNGWNGGVVWLVPTDKDIKDWKPIAKRVL
ncbi:2',3'-cyclic-nucleotide 3'-phosphodiesterase [Copromyces sp. CBS 386.78]|nr:2',3'-cyclic-nucleotide 3'-phosphodiesterase [Copromyces sp. CBS 386.78]